MTCIYDEMYSRYMGYSRGKSKKVIMRSLKYLLRFMHRNLV